MSNRELDAQVAELMGLPVKYHTNNPNNERFYYVDTPDENMMCPDVAHYSRDIAVAMQVAEKMRERGIYINIISQEKGYLITASKFQEQFYSYFNIADLRADSFEELPEAICRAAVMAAEAE